MASKLIVAVIICVVVFVFCTLADIIFDKIKQDAAVNNNYRSTDGTNIYNNLNKTNIPKVRAKPTFVYNVKLTTVSEYIDGKFEQYKDIIHDSNINLMRDNYPDFIKHANKDSTRNVKLDDVELVYPKILEDPHREVFFHEMIMNETILRTICSVLPALPIHQHVSHNLISIRKQNGYSYGFVDTCRQLMNIKIVPWYVIKSNDGAVDVIHILSFVFDDFDCAVGFLVKYIKTIEDMEKYLKNE